MKIGVILPTFEFSVSPALELADAAADVGIDGVFCYDHLWPMGEKSRPAIAPFPVLAAVASQHPSLYLGPLVARIGLVSDDVLCSQFRALDAISPGKVIAAIGTGDKLSAEENLAYGIDFAPAEVRRASLRSVAERLSSEGIEVWIGGGAQPTLDIARDLGVTVNLWSPTLDRVERQAAATSVTWAGLAPSDDDELAHLCGDLERAGVTWAVFGGTRDLERLKRETQRGS